MRKLQWICALIVTAFAVTAVGCSGFAYMLANSATWWGDHERSPDHAYGGDPRNQLDVYSPEGAKDRPVVVFFYGGSWQNGRRDLYRFVGAALAERGIVAVIPDYRLYPQVKFPTFLDDGAQALAWVQQHIAGFGGDPKRIVLMGHSAGGHEAAFLAYDRALLTKAGVDPEAIVGFVGLSGPYALEPNSDVLNTIFASPYKEADWQPVRFVTDKAPPTFLAHGDADTVVSIRHAEKLRNTLREHGVRVETEFYPGKGHADTIAAFSVPARGRAPVLEQTLKFVESVSVAPSSALSP